MKVAWAWGLTVAGVVGLFVAPPVARAGFVDGTLNVTLTHDSGFDDALGDPIRRSDSMTGVEVGFFDTITMRFPNQALDDTQSGGQSAAGAYAAVLVRPNNMVSPRFSGASFVEQANPDATASRPASLRLDYTASMAYDSSAYPPYARPDFAVIIHGFIGDSPDAYIQFQAQQTVIARDLNGEVLGSLTVDFGGSELLSAEHDVLHGGGRIDRTIDPDGIVDAFIVRSIFPATPYTPDAVRLGPPPLLQLTVDTVTLEYSGYLEILAKNDGSPSGIAMTEIPEPASLALLSLSGLVMLRRQRV